MLERISTMKNPNRQTSNKMLFTTIFETCGIAGKTTKDRQAQSRAKPKIFEFLDHCVSVNWIDGYTKVPDGVIIDPGKSTGKKKKIKG